MTKCEHCGLLHETTCPRIKAIEYDSMGAIKRVEFHPPQPVQPWVPNGPFIPLGGNQVRVGGPATFNHQPGCPRLTAAGDPPCTCKPFEYLNGAKVYRSYEDYCDD